MSAGTGRVFCLNIILSSSDSGDAMGFGRCLEAAAGGREFRS